MKTPQRPRRIYDADRHISQRMRERRIVLGLTQQNIAAMIGVTYQQFHKYERSINRVSAGRLADIAEKLGVSVSYFYEGLTTEFKPKLDDGHDRMRMEIAKHLTLISNPEHLSMISRLAGSLAEA